MTETALFAALEIPADINLRLFSAFLLQSGIPHRISEEGVNQVVWVSSEQDQRRVIHYYAQLASGELILADDTGAKTGRLSSFSRLVSNIWRFPLTMILILVTALFFPVSTGVGQGAGSELFAAMMLVDFHEIDGVPFFDNLAGTLVRGEYWRLLSPMFIHFGWMHIVFNLLWVWEIGRRIELVNGSSALLLVTLVSSLCANLLQYILGGPGLFGGMSGVIFGYLGFCLVWDKMVPKKKMGIRNGLYIFMLGFLVIGFTGAIDLLGLGSLANGAHLGGLLGGALTGAVAGMLHWFVPRAD